jgi:hypothetical protein
MRKYKFNDIEEYFSKKLENLKEVLASDKEFEAALLALCYIDALGSLFADGNTAKERFLNTLFLYGKVMGTFPKGTPLPFHKAECRAIEQSKFEQ